MHKLQEYQPDAKDPIKRIGRLKRIKNTGIDTELPPDGGCKGSCLDFKVLRGWQSSSIQVTSKRLAWDGNCQLIATFENDGEMERDIWMPRRAAILPMSFVAARLADRQTGRNEATAYD